MTTNDGIDAAFLAAVIDRLAHPIFVKDRSFRFVLLNEAICSMVGYSREQMLGKTDYDFFPREQADFFREKDEEMFAAGESVTIEQEPITDAAGNLHVLATTKAPLRDERGEITHLVGIIHDVTRVKAAEEALRGVNEALERRVSERTAALESIQEQMLRKERLAVLGRLAGGVAHQIRNPLGVIANASAILEKHCSSDEATQAVRMIRDEVKRANRIITDLLDYARVRPALRQAITVDELVDHTLASQSIPASVRVVKELPSLPRLSIDAAQVEDALSNLIQNAIESMPEGGTLTLTARRDASEVVLGIADTGEGIAPEVLERLYEPLVTTKPSGVGLGLTTALALVENQGGTLECVTHRGAGTRFDMRLPAVPSEIDAHAVA